MIRLEPSSADQKQNLPRFWFWSDSARAPFGKNHKQNLPRFWFWSVSARALFHKPKAESALILVLVCIGSSPFLQSKSRICPDSGFGLKALAQFLGSKKQIHLHFVAKNARVAKSQPKLAKSQRKTAKSQAKAAKSLPPRVRE